MPKPTRATRPTVVVLLLGASICTLAGWLIAASWSWALLVAGLVLAAAALALAGSAASTRRRATGSGRVAVPVLALTLAATAVAPAGSVRARRSSRSLHPARRRPPVRRPLSRLR